MRPSRGPFVGHVSYANVVATLALFISLGGASYAVVAIPAHSVGREQLKPGAVTSVALGFPLAVHGFVDPRVYEPEEHICPEGPTSRPGSGIEGVAPVVPGSCDVLLREGSPLGHIHLRAAGQLLVTGIVEAEGTGPPGETAEVRCGLFEDGREVATRAITIHSGETLSLPLQGLGPARAGNNTVGFAADAHYGRSRRGILIQRVSVVATALPR